MLNRVEAVIRAFDPCLSCSTHAYGQMPLHLRLVSPEGKLLDAICRNHFRRNMCKALVLACGNSQRGDDGVALQVVSYLREVSCDPATEFHCQQQWTPELAEPISHAEIVIFVDAAVGDAAGFNRVPAITTSSSTSLDSTHHHFSRLSLAPRAGTLREDPAARLLRHQSRELEFELGETLSEPVRGAIPRTGERIKALLFEAPMPED